MVELEYHRIALAAVNAWVLEEVLENPLLVSFDDHPLAPPRLSLVVVQILQVVTTSIV